MIIEVDFNSDEAIYIQLCNQIIMGIATSVIHEGDSLPSVRRLADTIGVNMHTVNKAYSVLKREGYISLDKRRGAVISLDIDKLEELQVMKRQLQIVLARGCCKNISRQEVHELVDEIFDDYCFSRFESKITDRRNLCIFHIQNRRQMQSDMLRRKQRR